MIVLWILSASFSETICRVIFVNCHFFCLGWELLHQRASPYRAQPHMGYMNYMHMGYIHIGIYVLYEHGIYIY